MRRRDFIELVGTTVFWPSLARAQTKRVPARIGVLWHAGSEAEEDPYFGWLRQGFREAGLVEGKDIVFEDRFPDEKPELYEKLATELANEKVDVLIAVSIPSALAAQSATTTIPIVFTPPPDPVALGLVASLARPGKNITGFSSMGNDVVAKRFQIFKEARHRSDRRASRRSPSYCGRPLAARTRRLSPILEDVGSRRSKRAAFRR